MRLLDQAEQALLDSSTGRLRSETSFLRHLLSAVGGDACALELSPAALFRATVQDRTPPQLQRVAMQFQKPEGGLRAGDWMLRAAAGTGDVGHVAVLAFADLFPLSSLADQGITAEGAAPGYYGIVIEGGAFPHTRKEPFARRFLDARGCAPPHTVILRPRPVDSETPDALPAEFLVRNHDCPDDAQMKPPRPLTDDCLNRSKDVHVAVVGGGLAGLMASRRLREYRVQVTLFEARGQVGGRVQSSHNFSKGRITEFGAELIGSFHTTWLTLARHYGLAMISRMDGELYSRTGLSTKLTLDTPLCREEVAKLEEEMETRVQWPMACVARTIGDPSRPWKESGTIQGWDKMTVADFLQKIPIMDKECKPKHSPQEFDKIVKGGPLWKMIEHLLVNDEVASLEEMNLLGLLCKVKGGQGPRFGTAKPNLMGYWTELELFRCADGCEALATNMAKEIKSDGGTPKKPVQIRLQEAVRGIEFRGEKVILSTQKVLGNLQLADGPPIADKQPYDYVIFAIPPSVWDGVTIKDHGIEVALKTEVGALGMGPAVKFFSNVGKRFWIAEKAAPDGGSLELGQVWDGTDNQTWLDGQNIVLSVFAGPIVDHKSAPTKAQCLAGLKLLFSGYESHLMEPPHYADWPHEPFIMTGYASPKRDQILTIGKRLSDPFHDRMFFAGEHTQMDFFGYMEGALRSGERAAEAIISRVCPQKAPELYVASR